MQIKATEMEGMRLETQRWVDNFNLQVAEIEKDRGSIRETTVSNLTNGNGATPF